MVDACTLSALAAGRLQSKKLSDDEHEGAAMTANSRVTRSTIALAVYVALQLEQRRSGNRNIAQTRCHL